MTQERELRSLPSATGAESSLLNGTKASAEKNGQQTQKKYVEAPLCLIGARLVCRQQNDTLDYRAQKNPFKIPPDEAIFTMRDKEREMRKQYASEMRSKPVAAKTTMASRMAATVPMDSESCRKVFSKPPATSGTGPSPHTAASLPNEAVQTLAAAAGGRRQMPQRVCMADFIARKREIFLVQMSLNVKRAEIRKLEQRILQRWGFHCSLSPLTKIPYHSSYNGCHCNNHHEIAIFLA
jgi:hypothetical protein